MDSPGISPDDSARGLTVGEVSAIRYEGAIFDKREVTGLMHAMMPSGVRVLDVGCGGGMVTQIANQGKGNEVVAIEPDPERAELARGRGINVLNTTLDHSSREALVCLCCCNMKTATTLLDIPLRPRAIRWYAVWTWSR